MAKKEEKEIGIEGEEVVRSTPDVGADFVALLQDYGLKEKVATVITKHIADTGSDRVFEKPKELLEKLARFPREIPPVTRRNVLDHWMAQNKIPIPEGYEEESELPSEELRRRKTEKQPEAKYSVDPDTGQIKVASTSDKVALTMDEAEKLSKNIEKKGEKGGKKVAYVYDTETKQVRMAKEGETGGTLDQAKELKKMADEGKAGGEESPFMQNAENRWVLNPKAKVTGVELMALEFMRKSQERGEAVDPMEAMTQAAEKIKVYREMMGGGEKGMPAWMTDPAEFIKTIRLISGEGKGDEGLKSELIELKRSFDELREDRHRDEMLSLQGQIKQQAEQHQREMKVIIEKMEELGKPTTGRSEMDLLHDIATGAFDEFKGLRGDVKGVLSSQGLPAPKTGREREERKKRFSGALENDKRVEELVHKLYLS